MVERMLHADSRIPMVRRTPTPLLLFLVIAASACGSETEEPEEVRVFERRRPTCELFCGIALDPVCGAQETIFTTAEECVDYCISEEATYWRLQEDDSDACADEFSSLYECAEQSTCEDQTILFNTPGSAYKTECSDQMNTLTDCYSLHPAQR